MTRSRSARPFRRQLLQFIILSHITGSGLLTRDTHLSPSLPLSSRAMMHAVSYAPQIPRPPVAYHRSGLAVGDAPLPTLPTLPSIAQLPLKVPVPVLVALQAAHAARYARRAAAAAKIRADVVPRPLPQPVEKKQPVTQMRVGNKENFDVAHAVKPLLDSAAPEEDSAWVEQLLATPPRPEAQARPAKAAPEKKQQEEEEDEKIYSMDPALAALWDDDTAQTEKGAASAGWAAAPAASQPAADAAAGTAALRRARHNLMCAVVSARRCRPSNGRNDAARGTNSGQVHKVVGAGGRWGMQGERRSGAAAEIGGRAGGCAGKKARGTGRKQWKESGL